MAKSTVAFPARHEMVAPTGSPTNAGMSHVAPDPASDSIRRLLTTGKVGRASRAPDGVSVINQPTRLLSNATRHCRVRPTLGFSTGGQFGLPSRAPRVVATGVALAVTAALTRAAPDLPLNGGAVVVDSLGDDDDFADAAITGGVLVIDQPTTATAAVKAAVAAVVRSRGWRTSPACPQPMVAMSVRSRPRSGDLARTVEGCEASVSSRASMLIVVEWSRA